MATIQELNAQREQLAGQLAALDKEIAEAQRGQRQEAVAQVRLLMAQYGLTAADLGAGAAGKPAKAAKEPSKVAAKYRDAATGSTWSGRGLKPRWLAAALAEGKQIEEFAV